MMYARSTWFNWSLSPVVLPPLLGSEFEPVVFLFSHPDKCKHAGLHSVFLSFAISAAVGSLAGRRQEGGGNERSIPPARSQSHIQTSETLHRRVPTVTRRGPRKTDSIATEKNLEPVFALDRTPSQKEPRNQTSIP
ncbi:hypothetical protein HD554DRAFT_9292 [Boletus coccyginus]|nr:hypothetical protein HD554DRAFT_9292 [Boletus coccyginus]